MSDLLAAANAASVELTPAELHGTVCGMAAAAARLQATNPDSPHEHEDLAFPLDAYVELVGADAVFDGASLQDFVGAALSELTSDDLRFAPLLPDDEVFIGDRVAALGEWCAAFLAGLGGLPGVLIDEGQQEIVEDFTAIAAVDDDVEESEESERQYFELAEHVKVGVLLLMRPGLEDDE